MQKAKGKIRESKCLIYLIEKNRFNGGKGYCSSYLCVTDVANKIGTYLKALAAADNHLPFYVALPSSSIDFSMRDGILEIPIEQREGEEVSMMEGLLEDGQIGKMRIVNRMSPVANYGFDVTPARLVTGLITEKGICEASEDGILALFPETGKRKIEGTT